MLLNGLFTGGNGNKDCERIQALHPDMHINCNKDKEQQKLATPQIHIPQQESNQEKVPIDEQNKQLSEDFDLIQNYNQQQQNPLQNKQEEPKQVEQVDLDEALKSLDIDISSDLGDNDQKKIEIEQKKIVEPFKEADQSNKVEKTSNTVTTLQKQPKNEMVENVINPLQGVTEQNENDELDQLIKNNEIYKKTESNNPETIALQQRFVELQNNQKSIQSKLEDNLKSELQKLTQEYQDKDNLKMELQQQKEKSIRQLIQTLKNSLLNNSQEEQITQLSQKISSMHQLLQGRFENYENLLKINKQQFEQLADKLVHNNESNSQFVQTYNDMIEEQNSLASQIIKLEAQNYQNQEKFPAQPRLKEENQTQQQNLTEQISQLIKNPLIQANPQILKELHLNSSEPQMKKNKKITQTKKMMKLFQKQIEKTIEERVSSKYKKLTELIQTLKEEYDE